MKRYYELIQTNKRLVIKRLLMLSFLLLLVRLIFFLRDGTSDLMETLLIGIIASLGVVSILIFLLVRKNLFSIIKEHRLLILLIGSLAVYESLFFVYHRIAFSLVGLFSFSMMAALLVAFIYLIGRRFRTKVVLFFLILFPMYFIAQDLYHGIFNRYFSFIEAITLKEGIESSEGMIHFTPLHFLYLLFMVISIILYIKIRKTSHHLSTFKLTKPVAKKGIRVLLFFFLLVQLNATYPPKTARLHLSDHYLYLKVFDNNQFVNHFGLSNYFFRDLTSVLTPKLPNVRDVKVIASYVEGKENRHQANGYTGLFEGKNVIFLIAESFDGIAIDESLTPNIIRLQQEGMVFTNHYVPVYPRTTCDTEFIYNTGMIPSTINGPTCYVYNKNSYSHSLANLFKEKGYLTQAFHSNYKEFYTRDLVYDGFGYDHFYGQHELGLSDTDIRYDTIFFETAKDIMIPEEGKFMSFVLTLSGHSPYSRTNLAVDKHIDRVDAVYGESVNEEIKMYIASQLEVDLVVGQLFDALEEKGRLDDTVVVFMTDHYPYTLKRRVYEEHTSITEEYQKMHSPLIIWGKGVEPFVYDGISSSFDVLPTIANLFQLQANYAYYVGEDLFQPGVEPIVLFKDGSWFDGVNYVKNGKLKHGTLDQTTIDQVTKEVNEAFDVGRRMLKVNYFKME